MNWTLFRSMVLACGIACGMTEVAKAADLETVDTPNWYLNINALALNRSTPQGGTIVSSNPVGVPFLSANDLDFDVAPGIEATFGYNLYANGSLEGRIMYSKVKGTNSFVSPTSFIGVGFTGPAGTNFSSDFSTTFGSAEMNWRHSYNDHLSVLVGLRAFSLDDSFGTVLNDNVATGLYEADNKLLGGQIGAQLSLLETSNPFQLSLSGKVGAFSNRSSAGIKEYSGDNFIGSFESGKETKTSFAAEIGLSAEYEVAPSLVLTAGYEAIWANNLALASNAASESQVNPSLLSTSVYRDDLWLHGVTVGVRLSF